LVLWASSSQLQQTTVISKLEVNIKTMAGAWSSRTIAWVKLIVVPTTPPVNVKIECFAYSADSSDSYKLLRAIAEPRTHLRQATNSDIVACM
jgi:hypothetical protein